MEINISSLSAIIVGIGAFLLSWLIPLYYPDVPKWLIKFGIFLGFVLIIGGSLLPWLPDWLWKPKIYPFLLMLTGILFLGIGGIWATTQRITSTLVTDDLVVEPQRYLARIEFNNDSILPDKEKSLPSNPFIIHVSNLGDKNIVNAKVVFNVVNSKLMETLNKPGIFKINQITPEAIWLSMMVDGIKHNRQFRVELRKRTGVRSCNATLGILPGQ